MVPLFRCKCHYALVVDHGEFVRVMFEHWNIHKQSGIVTANCPRCGHLFQMGEGNRVERSETSKSMPNILFSVGVV